MVNFLAQNLANIVIGALLVAIIAAISVNLIKKKKSGKSVGCGCGCDNCPSSGICHKP